MSTAPKNESRVCPFCGSIVVVGGSLLNGGDYPNFYLDEMARKFWRLYWPQLPFAKEAEACLKCGKVWAQMEVGSLRKNVQAYGTDELKHRLHLDHDAA
jgi:hypothetical protein